MSSIDATIRFSVVPEAVSDFTVSGLSANAVRLYAILDRYGNSEDAIACPARSTLARRCGYSVDTVDRAKEELVNAGYLEVLTRRSQKGDPDTNEYRLHREGVAAPVRLPSRIDAHRGSRTDAAQQRALLTESSGSTDVEPAGANGRDFVAWFVDEQVRVSGVAPLPRSLGRLGRDAKKLADQGVSEQTIRTAITELVESGMHVGAFAGLVDQVHRGGYKGRNGKPASGLGAKDLAERARELEAAGR